MGGGGGAVGGDGGRGYGGRQCVARARGRLAQTERPRAGVRTCGRADAWRTSRWSGSQRRTRRQTDAWRTRGCHSPAAKSATRSSQRKQRLAPRYLPLLASPIRCSSRARRVHGTRRFRPHPAPLPIPLPGDTTPVSPPPFFFSRRPGPIVPADLVGVRYVPGVPRRLRAVCVVVRYVVGPADRPGTGRPGRRIPHVPRPVPPRPSSIHRMRRWQGARAGL